MTNTFALADIIALRKSLPEPDRRVFSWKGSLQSFVKALAEAGVKQAEFVTAPSRPQDFPFPVMSLAGLDVVERPELGLVLIGPGDEIRKLLSGPIRSGEMELPPFPGSPE